MIYTRHPASPYFIDYGGTYFWAMHSESFAAYCDGFSACVGDSWSADVAFSSACSSGIVFW